MTKSRMTLVIAVLLIFLGIFLLFNAETFAEKTEKSYEKYRTASEKFNDSIPDREYISGGGLFNYGVPYDKYNEWIDSDEYQELSDDVKNTKKQYERNKKVTDIAEKGAWPAIIIGAVLLVVAAIFSKNFQNEE